MINKLFFIILIQIYKVSELKINMLKKCDYFKKKNPSAIGFVGKDIRNYP